MKRLPELNFNEFQRLDGTEAMSIMLRQKYLLENDNEVEWVRENCSDTFHIRRDDYPSPSSIVYFVSVRDVVTFLEIYGHKERALQEEAGAPIHSIVAGVTDSV